MLDREPSPCTAEACEDFIRDPKNLLYSAFLFLLFLLLFWLFVPLTSFFSNYIKALKEKGILDEEGTSKGSVVFDDPLFALWLRAQ